MTGPLRNRTLFLWLTFVAAGLIAAGAVFHLYRINAYEIEQQASRVLQEQGKSIAANLAARVQHGELTVMAEIASFHLDGLDRRLRQWDQANELILGTFTWSPTSGFEGDLASPSALVSHAALQAVWTDFREWRKQHPGKAVGKFSSAGYVCDAYRTVDAVLFPEPSLGYQNENVEMVQHAQRPADPWACRMAHASNPGAPWVVWYQLGLSEGIRGCVLDARRILDEASLSPETNIVVTRIEHRPFSADSSPSIDARSFPLYGFPASSIVVLPGSVFAEKASSLRLTASLAAGVLGVFVLVAAALARSTRKMSAEAERKITFVAHVSHELRTPLTSIQMLADLLRTPDLSDEKRLKFAGTVAAETTRLRALIEKLLTFNRLQQKKQGLTPVPTDVERVVRQAVDQMGETLSGAGLKCEVNIGCCAAKAWADESLLKQALLNLLENAAKHARGATTVKVSVTQDADRIYIDVTDDGCGVPVADRGRIFEPFVQGASESTNKTPGFGLGLSIARETLRQLGGDVVLAPAERGAHFRTVLRAIPPPAIIS